MSPWICFTSCGLSSYVSTQQHSSRGDTGAVHKSEALQRAESAHATIPKEMLSSAGYSQFDYSMEEVENIE